LTQAKYPIAEREIVISFKNGLKCKPTDENAFRALKTVNKVIAENKDLEKPPFICARFTLSNNLALTAGLDNCALDYESHLKVITESIKFVGDGTAIVNEKWSKFLLHGVPTFGTLEEIRNDVEIYYPKLKLGQTPRWLAPADKRTGKPASTIVLAFIGTVTSKDIDRSLTVLNKVCHLSPYYPYGPQTQCHRCQQYGHATELCGVENPACAVCAGNHLTKDHQCEVSKCKTGPVCVHGDIKCAACGNPHKASDRSCPMRIKASQEFRRMKSERASNTTSGSEMEL
jgi:hypothetical protein